MKDCRKEIPGKEPGQVKQPGSLGKGLIRGSVLEYLGQKYQIPAKSEGGNEK